MTDIFAGGDLSRSQFLRRSAAGSLALVSGGAVLATVRGDAIAQSGSDPSDTDIAAVAAGAELLAVHVYGVAIRSKLFKGGALKYLKGARAAEQAHYDALAGVLKGAGLAAPQKSDFTYDLPTLKSARQVLNFAVSLETAFLGAYLTAVDALDTPALKPVAAAIAANEASHLGFFRNARLAGSTVPAIPKAVPFADVIEAVGTYQKKKK